MASREERGEVQTQTMWPSEKLKTNRTQGMGNQRNPQENEMQKAKKMERDEEPEE